MIKLVQEGVYLVNGRARVPESEKEKLSAVYGVTATK